MKTYHGTITAYRYDELDDKAKESVKDWYRDTIVQEDFEYMLNLTATKLIREFERLFDVNVKEYYCDLYTHEVYRVYLLTPDIHVRTDGMDTNRLRTWFINNYGDYVTEPRTFYNRTWKKTRKSKVFKSRDCVLTGTWLDNYIMQPIYDFIDGKENFKSLEELYKECVNSMFSAIIEENEDRMKVENMEAYLEETNKMFFKDGRPFELDELLFKVDDEV